MHARNHIWKETDHIVIAHGHVGDNLLKGDFLRSMILIFLAFDLELLSKLRDFPLSQNERLRYKLAAVK